MIVPPHALGLATALGIGLLIGLDREKRQEGRGAAGVRTFALVALLGAVGQIAGGVPGLLVCIVVTAVFAAMAYRVTSQSDPGLTTEIALVLTCALGGVAQVHVVVAAASGVLVALLLVSRGWLNAWARDRLSPRELTDAILLAACALVILPLLPDRTVDPFGVVNPRLVWLLATTVMIINAAGYVALRAFGDAKGLAIAGVTGGFVSSVATIASMGSRARAGAAGAIAGATLSSIGTVVQLAILIAITNRALLQLLWLSLLGAGSLALIYGVIFSLRAFRQPAGAKSELGRAFQPRTAIIFALVVTAVLFLSAALAHFFGATGGLAGVAVAGFADAHASAVSAASLAASGGLSANAAVVAILVAFTTNTLTKGVAAWVSGGSRFAAGVIPGLVLMLVAAWAGAFAAGLRLTLD